MVQNSWNLQEDPNGMYLANSPSGTSKHRFRRPKNLPATGGSASAEFMHLKGANMLVMTKKALLILILALLVLALGPGF